MRNSILTVIISCVLSMISVLCLNPMLISFWGYLEGNNLVPNVIDFLGNIIISLSSAYIAYFVSKKQVEKSERKIQLDFKQKNDIMLKRLAKEIELNITLIEASVEHSDPMGLLNIELSVWDWAFKNVDLPSDIFDNVYDLYCTLKIIRSSCSEMSKEELESNASTYIYKIESVHKKIIDYINNEIK